MSKKSMKFNADKMFESAVATRQNRIRRALRTNETPKEQMLKVAALIGARAAIGADVRANAVILKYAKQRFCDGMDAALTADPQLSCFYLALVFDKDSKECERGYDFKAMKRSFEQILNPIAEHYVVMSCSLAAPKLSIEMRAIFWNSDRTPDSNPAPTKRRRDAQGLATVSPTAVASAEVHDAVAALCSVGGLQPVSIKSLLQPEQEFSKKALRNEMHCLLLEGMMPISRTSFGRGRGKTIFQSLKREVLARAAALDLYGTAALQPAAVTSLLAELPSDKDGGRYILPVVKLL